MEQLSMLSSTSQLIQATETRYHTSTAHHYLLFTLVQARMLVEAGLALVLQEKDITSTSTGGVYTPAVGIGSVFTQRLINTGCSFQLSIESEASGATTNKKSA
jgi:short subunit dehydrogenase-like uncharacterized protein